MLNRVFQHVLLLLVRGYRYWLKPWLGNSCRFEPSCSAYAQQALQQHGAARGTALVGWRLLRCQPWCEGGCDEVPEQWTSAWASTKPPSKNASRGFFTALDMSKCHLLTLLIPLGGRRQRRPGAFSSEAPSSPVDAAPVNRKQT